MATVLGLALKISADATGIQQKLTPVERALKQLDAEAAKVTEVFKTFGGATEGAGRAQQQFATDLAFLQSALRTGKIDGEQFAAEFKNISDAANATAESFREGARITEQSRTEEEKRAAQLERLQQLLDLGAISEETYSRQKAQATGAAAEAARQQAAAEKERTDAATRAAAIVEANLTKEQKAQRDYGVATRELNALRNQGLLTEQEYATALQRVSTDYAKATLAADKFANETKNAANAGLKFNELSGILSALPGPIGNVAGRLSGLSSAGEGLARVFSGGLSQGISSIGTSVAGLVNPFTAAVAGVAAFGAGAAAIAQGLVALEDRVEKLGNTADKLGVSFEFIQTLEAAAARSGTSIDAVSAAFGRLQKNVTGVDEESKAAQAALASIGVTAEQLQALSPEDQYRLIGEQLQAIQNPAERTAAAIGLFGKSGAELLPFFKNLGGASDDMERFGRALTEIDRQRIDDFGAGIDALGVATQGLGQSLLLPFAGLGEGIAKAFAEIISGITAIVDPIGQVLEPVLTTIGRVIEGVGIGLRTLGRIVGAVFGPFADAAQMVSRAIEPLLDSVLGLSRYLIDAAEAFLGMETSASAAADQSQRVNEQTKELSREEQKARGEREKTFQRLREEVNNAIDDSRKFGAAGREASAAYEASIESLKKKLSSGLIDEEQFRRAVRIAGQNFDAEIKRIEDRTQLEIKVKENAEKAVEKVSEQIDKAAIKAEDFGAAGDRALGQFAQRADSLRQQFVAGFIDEKQLEQGVAAANREYEKQIDAIKRANDERQKQVEADRKRTESLLDEMDKTRAVQRDREAVERDVARLRSEAAAQGFFTPEQRQQLQDLQRLQGELAEKQRAVAQGFEQGYAEAFDRTREKFDDLVAKSEEFGSAGEQAALRLAEGLNNAARLAERGSINEEAYQREVERQQRLYEQELAQMKAVADERLKTNEAVDQMLLLQSVGGDEQRAAAKKQLVAIELEIQRVQQEIAAARKADDYEAIKAGTARLSQLDQAAALERDIASGAAKQREEFQKRVEQGIQQQQQAQQAYAQQQQKIFEEQKKAADAEAKRQEDRIARLNTLGSQTITGTDIRTQAGANLVIDLAANAQDPALIQQRLQTKLLQQIAVNLGQAASNYFNQPVAIVGYSSFGQ